MIKLCIFDLDGTLTDTLSTIAHYANTALKGIGLEPIAVEDYKTLVGDGRDELIRRMLRKRGANADGFLKAARIYDAAYENDVIYDTHAYDGIKELLAELKNEGVMTAVLSNKPHNVAELVVSRIFGADSFCAVFGQRENIPKKPAPDGALSIAAKLGADRSECLFIGDTNVDIKTGVAAGMDTAGVLWGFRGEAELREAGAKHICRVPSDILKIVRESIENNK